MNECGLSGMGSAFCFPEWRVHSGQVRAGLGQREPLSAQAQGAGAGEKEDQTATLQGSASDPWTGLPPSEMGHVLAADNGPRG